MPRRYFHRFWFCCGKVNLRELVERVCSPEKVRMDSTSPPKSYAELAKSLHDKTVELDVHLRNLTEINSGLKEKCVKALAALRELCGSDSLAARISCSICCTRERTHGLLPCGHAGLCEACSSRVVRRGRCHFCRGTVESNIRIFL